MRFRSLGALGASVGLAALLVTSAFGLAGGQSAKDRTTTQKSHVSATTYIVQMSDDPVVAYEGGTAGLDATAPAEGDKVNPNSQKVQKYVAHLNGKHADAAAAVGAEKFYDYAYSFNGFAAKMSQQQAEKLAQLGGVVDVSKDVLSQPETSSTPSFLGLDQPGTGLWAKLGGPASAGENVVVGIVDTGIWPEHPSFSDQSDFVFRTGSSGKRSQVYGPAPSTWHGECQSGEQFSQDMCTNKLIGARYYLSGFGHFGIVKGDYKSARDNDSHGSHTASTAAGNHGVPATGAAAGFGKVSGMAPRARVAAYKVCWNGDDGGCASSDSMAAIDQAVADGVDVLNFSISGTSTNFLDPVEVAFLFAARAGVFVAASAGNSGPTASTVAHPSPWLTTVAASTHSRASEATLTLGNGNTYVGASSNQTVTSGSVVFATASGLAGASATQVRLCYPGTLDPAKVSGKIVVCDRGAIARVDKSKAVQQAGGKGMILTNTNDNSLNADLHFVPTIHINNTDGAAVKAYVTSAGASATAIIGAVSGAAPAPKMAAFSSRGPLLGASGNLLKPDVTAPGVDILAAVSPDSGREFDLLSGTSMSSPHVAGLGALLTHAHPDWTPAMIKSALMTTGYDTLDGDVFAHGAGHVKPNSAVDPGLVYKSTFFNWLQFLKGQGLCCSTSTTIPAINASDLNLASIAIGSLAGTQTVLRRVTNVGTTAATYTATASVPGIDVTVTPSTLTLAPGASASFTVKLDTNSSATLGSYTSGHLVWTDGAHTVRSPIVAKPVALAAPGEVSGNGTAQSYTVRFGYTGSFSTSTRGLVAATQNAGSVSDDPTNTFVVGGPGTMSHSITIAPGTTYARVALYDDQVGASNDLDLYLYNSAGVQVGSSGSGTSQEIINLKNPPAGTYTAWVHGWQTAGGGTANYILYSWGVGTASAGNMTATGPASATTGASGTINLAFTGLAAGTRYLGAVDYSNGSSTIGSTIVYQKTP
ncbi:MAG TPA: S8 family serine peptidase [Plantibacter sp.]|uniref:S8 family serine peptidase n=1 Tax=Plantibacter sp. TaxID=1871045 RepID=UPI002BEACCED|nr:S8 family serine peptidase [Plantibacter sp.]